MVVVVVMVVGASQPHSPRRQGCARDERKFLAREGPSAQGSEKGADLNSSDIGVFAPSSAAPRTTELSINLPELPNQQNRINTMEYF